MRKEVAIIVGIIVAVVLFTPFGLQISNKYFETMKQTDNQTNYKVKKQVEDTARAMIVSYNSDKNRYEQYKDGDTAEKKGWAEQAKIRANNTAFQYNDYILKNNYVWKDNVPEDIKSELEVIE